MFYTTLSLVHKQLDNIILVGNNYHCRYWYNLIVWRMHYFDILQACQRTCYQKHCIRECGCGDPTEPMRGAALGLGTDTIKACDSSNITQG
jgi:hypothetical protein